MNYVKQDITLEDIELLYSKKNVRDVFKSYEFEYLCQKVDQFILSRIRRDDSAKRVQVINYQGAYVVVDLPLDAAIAKVIFEPEILEYFPQLHEYVINKRKPYVEQLPSFFDSLEVDLFNGVVDFFYLDIADIDHFDTFDERQLLNAPNFFHLLKRTATRCYENFIIVRKNTTTNRYTCVKNSHLLFAHQVLSDLDSYKDKLSEQNYSQLESYKGDPYFSKIRVEEGFFGESRFVSISLSKLSFSTLSDTYFHYINEHPEIFLQLTQNIINNGFNSVEINAYYQDGKVISPFTGTYQILALKAINNPSGIKKVFPQIADEIIAFNNKTDFNFLTISFQKVGEQLSSGYQKIAGVLSLTKGERITPLEVANVEISKDGTSDNSAESEEEDEELIDEFMNSNARPSYKHLSVTETIEISLPLANDVADSKPDSPIKYGKTILKLDEIESIDYVQMLKDGMSFQFKSDTMDLLTMKKTFPILKAIPCGDQLYRINPIDQVYLLMRMIHLKPSIIKDLDKSFYYEIKAAKNYYDVKKTLAVEVRVPTEEKSKKNNIFHHMIEGQLNFALLKADKNSLTSEQLVELSVIKDRAVLERFNPIKDPVIFYRTARSFLECLHHLYYLNLDKQNIYHDNGSWANKFKPLSAWMKMYKYIYYKLPCAIEIFPKDIWEHYLESMRMEMVYILNEVTHLSATADAYQDECRDFIWQSAGLDCIIKYMLENFRKER